MGWNVMEWDGMGRTNEVTEIPYSYNNIEVEESHHTSLLIGII